MANPYFQPEEIILTFHLGPDLVEITANLWKKYDGPNTPDVRFVEFIEILYFDGLKEDFINPPNDINWELMFWSHY